MRSVLELVDGKRTVDDIVREFGDASIAEAALADLERSGFIETPQGRRAREAQRSAAGQAAGGKAPGPNARAFDEDDASGMDPLDFSGAGIAGTGPGASERQRGTGKAPWEDDEELAELASGRAPPPDYRVPVFDEEDSVEQVSQAGSRFERFGRGLKYVAAAVAALLVLAVGLVLFFPYDRHLPRMELRVRASVGEPVRMGDMRLSFAPAPSIAINSLSIGDGAFTARRVTAVPRLFSLFSEQKQLRELHLQQVEMDASVLPRLPGWINGTGGTKRYFATESLRFSQLTLRLGDLVLEGLGGDGVLDRQGRLLRLRFKNAEGTLSGELEPREKSYRLLLSADEWRLPQMEGVQLSAFAAEGVLEGGGLKLEKFDARSFDGLVSGNLALDWANGGTLSGTVELRRVAAERLMKLLRPGLLVQGELSGRLQVSGRAPGLSQLAQRVSYAGEISLQRGTISNMNFAEAVKSRGGPVRGGETRFEQLTADFRQEGEHWVLRGMHMNAGLMKGSGSATIGSKDLFGLVHVSFQGGNQMGAPIAISGTLRDPYLAARR